MEFGGNTGKMILTGMEKKLRASLTEERFIHSLNVRDKAIELAAKYSYNKDKAAIAGLLHDCARDLSPDVAIDLCRKYNIKTDRITKKQTVLLHAWLGAELARTEYGIYDTDILDAIRFHTFGSRKMNLLAKIIFVADCIEPDNDFDGVEEIRSKAYNDIDEAIILTFDFTLRYIISKGELIHPVSIDTRNFFISQRKK